MAAPQNQFLINRLTVTWKVTGDPHYCKFGQIENGELAAAPVYPSDKGIPKSGLFQGGVDDVSSKLPIIYGNDSASYIDPMGIGFLPFEWGVWNVEVGLSITPTCKSLYSGKSKAGPTYNFRLSGPIWVGMEGPDPPPPPR